MHLAAKHQVLFGKRVASTTDRLPEENTSEMGRQGRNRLIGEEMENELV